MGVFLPIMPIKFILLRSQIAPSEVFDAANHTTLYCISILDVYEVTDLLHMMWVGIWVHPYIVTPVQLGAKL